MADVLLAKQKALSSLGAEIPARSGLEAHDESAPANGSLSGHQHRQAILAQTSCCY